MITVLRWCAYAVAELFLLALQLLIMNLLPPPGNFIQVIWVLAPLLILFNRFHLILGLAGVFYFFLGLLSSHSFGAMLSIGVVTLVALEKLYRLVLTNRSIYSALALAAAGAFLNRLLVTAFLFIFDHVTVTQIRGQLVFWGWETILTALITGLCYLTAAACLTRFRWQRSAPFSL